MKTIREHLEILEEPYQSQALQNMLKFGENDLKAVNTAVALKMAFLWDDTPEGWDYWDSLHTLLCISEAYKD